jgi:sugar phosphate isomerase/epimerase
MKFTGFTDEAALDWGRQVQALKMLGWSAIETRMVMVDGKSVHFDDVSDGDFDRMLGELKEAGLIIICYGTQIANWARPINGDFAKDTDELRRILPRMRKSGTRFARIMSYPNDGRPEANWRQEVVRRLKELTRMAEGEGVLLCHENCSGYGGEDAKHALDMLDDVGSPALKFIFDTGNFWKTGYSSLGYFKDVYKHVVHIHIKDYVRDETLKDGWRPVFAGDGVGDVEAVLREARRRGYDGWYSMEPHLSAIAHEGRLAKGPDSWDVFVEYGRRFEKLYKAV